MGLLIWGHANHSISQCLYTHIRGTGQPLFISYDWPRWPASCSISLHYDDVIMDSIASQITSLTIVYSTVHSGADQSKHQSSASLAFVWEIHRWPVNFPHKWPITRKMFPFEDVIMHYTGFCCDLFCYNVCFIIVFGGHLFISCSYVSSLFRWPWGRHTAAPV